MLRTPKIKTRYPSNAHARSPKQEKESAAKLGGRVVKASGSGDEKGDVRVKGVLRLESKCTSNKSFSVTREMIQKIEDAALASGELPAIEIEFLDAQGKVEKKVAVVPIYVLEMICGE